MQRLRESLTLALLLLLPFHAFIVTVGTKLVLGQHKSPPLLLSAWKELVLVLLLVLILAELCIKAHRLRNWRSIFTVDRIDVCIVVFTVLAVIVSAWQQIALKQFLFGVKYSVWPLVIFFFARRVSWSIKGRSQFLLIMLGVIVAGLGGLFLLLPAQVLEWLGYSETHSLYLAHKTTSAFQMVGGTNIRRLQSVLSGPNQAGIWLLIPFSFLWAFLLHVLMSPKKVLKNNWLLIAAIGLVLMAIFMSFSRSAWLGALVVMAYTAWQYRTNTIVRPYVRVISLLALALLVGVSILFSEVLFRTISNSGHIQKPIQAIATILQHPFGLGLGAAGPASHVVSDSCTEVAVGSDIRWSDPYPELCIFADGAQIKPTNRQCRCATITENWYLQVGVELGMLGMLLFLYLIYCIAKVVRGSSQAVFYACISTATAALFLHAWEDSAVVYTLMLLLAFNLPSYGFTSNVQSTVHSSTKSVD